MVAISALFFWFDIVHHWRHSEAEWGRAGLSDGGQGLGAIAC